MMKKLTALLLLVACFPLQANAMTAALESNNSTGRYTISGNADEARFNQLISIKVTDSSNNEVYYSYVMTDNEGAFSYDFGLGDPAISECPTGDYTLHIGAVDAATPLSYPFTHMNSTERTAVINDINTYVNQFKAGGAGVQTSKDSLVTLLNAKGDKFGASLSEFSRLDDATKKVAAGLILDKGTYDKLEDFAHKFYRYAVIAGLRVSDAKTVENLFDRYTDNLTLTDCVTLPIYNAVDKIAVYKRLAGGIANTDTEFAKIFNEAVILAKIEKAANWGEVVEVINTYESNFPFTFSSYNVTKERIAINTASKSYMNMNDFEMAVKALVETSQGGLDNSGGGRDSGGTAMMPGIVPPLTNQDLSQVFADISEAEWASEAINSLYDKGIVAGTDKNHFSPNDNITREAYVKIIVGAFGLTSDGAKAEFIDVSNSHWAYKEINIANALGVVEGISETEFGIGRAITREDMMVIASRAIDKTDIRLKAIKEAEEFTDAAAISDYAKTAVKRLVEAGYVSGFEDGSVQPKGNTTRAQAAYVIYKLMGGK